jgi:hypothetical protein
LVDTGEICGPRGAIAFFDSHDGAQLLRPGLQRALPVAAEVLSTGCAAEEND